MLYYKYLYIFIFIYIYLKIYIWSNMPGEACICTVHNKFFTDKFGFLTAGSNNKLVF